MNDANIEGTNRVKLRFEMRLQAKDFGSLRALSNFAESIPTYVEKVQFVRDLLTQLSAYSDATDHLDHSRYGWMQVSDIEVSNAIALPKAAPRDQFSTGGIVLSSNVTLSTFDLIVLSIALGALLFLCIVFCMYWRLSRENAVLAKDKRLGSSMRKMWDKFMTTKIEQFRNLTGAQKHKYKELQMEEFASAIENGELTADDDTQLDVDDDAANRS